MTEDQTKVLPLKDAYKFGKENGLEEEMNSIQSMEIDWDKNNGSTIRRGYIVALFEAKGLYSRFKDLCWSRGNTPPGEASRRYFLTVKSQYENFLEGVEPEEVNDDHGQVPNNNQSFRLEEQLRTFLYENWNRTDLGKDWAIYSEPGSISPDKEYKTDVGRIDILAKHKTEPKWLVIELKRDQSSDKTVGQILRYMAWIQRHLAKGEQVEGVIVCYEPDLSLLYAISDQPNVQLQTYKVSFVLNAVPKL